jgi:hypothetical protein
MTLQLIVPDKVLHKANSDSEIDLVGSSRWMLLRAKEFAEEIYGEDTNIVFTLESFEIRTVTTSTPEDNKAVHTPSEDTKPRFIPVLFFVGVGLIAFSFAA